MTNEGRNPTITNHSAESILAPDSIVQAYSQDFIFELYSRAIVSAIVMKHASTQQHRIATLICLIENLDK
jgi:hypothetical protein